MVYAVILLLTWLLTAVAALIIPFYASRYRGGHSGTVTAQIISGLCAVVAVTPAVVFAAVGGLALSFISPSSSYFAPIAAYLVSLMVFLPALSIFFVTKPKYLQGIALLTARNALLFLLCSATLYGLCKIESRNIVTSVKAQTDRLYAAYLAEYGGPDHKGQSSDNAAAASNFLFTNIGFSPSRDVLVADAIGDLKTIREKQAGEALEKNDAAIKELMRLFDKPEWTTTMRYDEKLPPFIRAKGAVNLLLLHALRDHGEKKYQAAADTLRVCQNISAHLRLSSYFFIGQLVANQVDGNIFNVMTAMVLDDPAQAAALTPVTHGKGEAVFRGMRKAVLEERLIWSGEAMRRGVFPLGYDEEVRWYDDILNALFSNILLHERRMNYEETLAMIDSQVIRGEWDSKAGKLSEDAIIKKTIVGDAIAMRAGAYFERIASVATLHEAEAAVIALVLYKTRKGHYPDTLQELVPDYLPVPIKPYVKGVGMALEKSSGGVVFSITGFPDGKYNRIISFKP